MKTKTNKYERYWRRYLAEMLPAQRQRYDELLTGRVSHVDGQPLRITDKMRGEAVAVVYGEPAPGVCCESCQERERSGPRLRPARPLMADLGIVVTETKLSAEKLGERMRLLREHRPLIDEAARAEIEALSALVASVLAGGDVEIEEAEEMEVVEQC